MLLQQLFARKSLEALLAEAAGENRLRRVLGMRLSERAAGDLWPGPGTNRLDDS